MITPPYTLWDSEVRTGVEKLPDDFILEMIVLMDYAEPNPSDVAEVFGLPVTEVYNFFHVWSSHSVRRYTCTAEGWCGPLGLNDADTDDLQAILASATIKASQCLEHGVNYVDHTYDLLVTLDAAWQMQSLDLVDGIDTLEELQKAWELFETGATATNKLLARRRAVPELED